MVGPPGAGKSLLASCMPGILPELTPAEALEVSMIASVAGTLIHSPWPNKVQQNPSLRLCALSSTNAPKWPVHS
jgi:predicted ATPase with chaperone activity